MLNSLFADPELLTAYRESLASRKKGPHGAIGRLQRYISAEQELNRIHQKLDPEIAATMLMASSFFKAFTSQFFAEPSPSDAVFKNWSQPRSTKAKRCPAINSDTFKTA